jgi:hypothetical protein
MKEIISNKTLETVRFGDLTFSESIAFNYDTGKPYSYAFMTRMLSGDFGFISIIGERLVDNYARGTKSECIHLAMQCVKLISFTNVEEMLEEMLNQSF